MDWYKCKKLTTVGAYYQRRVKEAIWIRKNGHSMNEDAGRNVVNDWWSHFVM